MLELALADALRRDDDEITSENLLAGVAAAENTVAQRLLPDHGLDAEAVNAELDRAGEP